MSEPHPGGLSAPAEPGAFAKPRALSCLTLPAFSDACGLVGSKYSCLVVKTHRRHLALAPKYLHKKRSGIREHLSAELLKYSVALNGVPVAFDNIKLVGELGDIYDDIGYIHVNIEADFVIFQPKRGQKLVGVVNKKAPSHIGCLVHGCFNASIPRPFKIPVDVWQHTEITIGDQMEFEVSRLDSDAVGVFFILGRLDKKLELEILSKMEAASKEQNANVPQDEEQNGSEIAVDETTVLSEGTSKKKRKRLSEETLSECRENQEDTNWNMEEAPKKKKKKHRHLEVLSQNQSVEADGSGDNSAMETSSDYQEALQNANRDLAVDNSADGLDMSVLSSGQEHKAKKSKKKKHKERFDLESNFHNGTAEDSLIDGDSMVEELGTEPGTTKKKHKKKHKNTSVILEQDPANDIASNYLVETPTDNFEIHQETPKVKKHK
ncbi:DNA-directed RNA polymerase I subunit, partial [Pristimantis euphronides]